MIRPLSVALALLCLLPVQAGAAAPASAGAGTVGQAVAPASAAPTWKPDPPTYGTTVVEGIRIPMSDGVELVGDAMYPTDLKSGEQAPGPFHALLVMNGYFCNASQTNLSAFGADWTPYVTRGYLLLSVCVRGSGRSGGDFEFLGRRDALDGAELVEWAAKKLPRSNGKVGMIGGSYPGLEQFFAAGASRSPALKAIAPVSAGAELYRETAFSGGVPTETFQYTAAGLAALVGPRAGVFGATAAAETAAGGPNAYANEYWDERTPGRMAQAIAERGIPTLLGSGWKDIYTRGSLEMYTYLQNAYAGRPVYGQMPPGQPASPLFQLYMADGGHGAGVDTMTQLQWFDTWLKGRNTPMRTTKTPLHLFSLGTKTWVNTSTFPLTNAYTPYYLGEGGALTTRRQGEDGAEALQYTQPSASGGQLSFTSTPLRDGATLAGPISATLYASTTGSNLHLIAKLQDVAPDGTATTITSGSLAGSLRELNRDRSWTDKAGVVVRPYQTFTKDEFLTPEQVARLDISLSPRVTVLAPGHALRLVVTTQMDPKDCAGPLLGVNPCYPTATQLRTFPGTYSLAHGPRYPSAVNVPLLPRTCLLANGGTGTQPTTLSGPAPSAATPCVEAAGSSKASRNAPASRPGSPNTGVRPAAADVRPAAATVRLPATGSDSTLPFLALFALVAALAAKRRSTRMLLRAHDMR